VKTDLVQNRKDANWAKDSGSKLRSSFGARFSVGSPSVSFSPAGGFAVLRADPFCIVRLRPM